jgi:hypothetical protein
VTVGEDAVHVQAEQAHGAQPVAQIVWERSGIHQARMSRPRPLGNLWQRLWNVGCKPLDEEVTMRRAIGKWIQIGMCLALPATALAQSDTRTDLQKQDKTDVSPGSNVPMNTPSDLDTKRNAPMGTDTLKPSDTNPTNEKDYNKLDTGKPSDVDKQPESDLNKPSDTSKGEESMKTEEHTQKKTTTKTTKHRKQPATDTNK